MADAPQSYLVVDAKVPADSNPSSLDEIASNSITPNDTLTCEDDNDNILIRWLFCRSATPTHKWQMVICLCIILALTAEVFTWDAFTSVTPALLEDKIITVAEAGYIVGVGHALSFFAKLGLGKATDTFKARKTFLCIMFIQGVGTLCFGFSNSIPSIMISFYLSKIAAAGCWPCFTKLIGNWYEEKHYGFIWGIVSAFATIISIILYGLIGLILTSLNWRWVFWILAVSFFVITFILYFIVWDSPLDLDLPPLATFGDNIKEGILSSPPPYDAETANKESQIELEVLGERDLNTLELKDERAPPYPLHPSPSPQAAANQNDKHPLDGVPLREAIRYFVNSPSFWGITIGLLCVTSAATFEGSVTLYLTDKWKLEPGIAAAVTASYAVGTCIAVVLGAIAYSKFSKRSLFILNMVALIITFIDIMVLWSLNPESTPVTFVLFWIFLFGLGITVPWYYPMSIYSLEAGGKDHAGFLSGVLDGISNLGVGLFSVAAGKMLDIHDWDSFFVMVGSCTIASIVFLGFFLYLDSKKVSKSDVDWGGLWKLFCGGKIRQD